MIPASAIIIITIFSTIFTFAWYWLYSKIVSKYQLPEEYASRIVAGIHGLVAIALSFICILQGPDPLVEPGAENTYAQVMTMMVSIGYFTYDLWWCVKYQPEPVIILVHHVVSILAIFMILMHGRSGSEAIAGIASLEFTNPLLQARWFLRTYGYQQTTIYTIVETAFISLFLILRLGYGSKLLYSVMVHDTVILPVKIVTVLLYVISVIFIYFIGQFIVRKYVFHTRTHCCDYICEENCEHVQKLRSE